MVRSTMWLILSAGILGVGVGACAVEEDTPAIGEMQAEMPMTGAEGAPGMEGMPGMTGMETTDMSRHSQEADSMAAVVREHVAQMRGLNPMAWHDRMGEHVGQVSQMLALINRQMREMDMGGSMSHEQMGEMMGMTAEEHDRMMTDMQELRSTLEELQTASPEEVGERMPGHLERLEGMADLLSGSGAHRMHQM